MNPTSATPKDRRRTRAPARLVSLLALSLTAGVGVVQSAAVRADELGRLFFTPQQRQELDRRRQSNVQETAEPVVESSVTVNGHVARSTSGKTTTWVNGVPQHDSYASRDPSRVHLDTATVKIGQTLDRTRGEVKDGLQGGTVSANRKAPAQ